MLGDDGIDLLLESFVGLCGDDRRVSCFFCIPLCSFPFPFDELDGTGYEHPIVTGLHHIVVGSCFIAFNLVSLILKGCEHDNGDILQLLIGLQCFDNIVAVGVGKHHVTDQQGGRVVPDAFDATLSVGIAADVEIDADFRLDLFQHVGIIFNDGDVLVVECIGQHLKDDGGGLMADG